MLATGSTMEKVYEQLGRMHKEEGLDFSLVRTFNLDEYVGLPRSDRHSYRHYMNHHLFMQVNIDLRNTPPPVLHAMDKPVIDMMSGVSWSMVIDTRLSCARFLAFWL